MTLKRKNNKKIPKYYGEQYDNETQVFVDGLK